MKQIATNVVLLEREDWGARTDLPRLGGPEAGYALIPRERRVYDIRHHTVVVDTDVSKNVWESVDEVKAGARRLQVIRPDLGADTPYNFVGFLMPAGAIAFCEGRGYDRSGAHTAGEDGRQPYPYNYFNVSGIATSLQGNFELAIDLTSWRPALQAWGAHLKSVFPNIGTATVCGQPICGHRDYSRFSGLNATACPGRYLYEFLPQLSHGPADPEEDDEMKLYGVRVTGTFAGYYVYVSNGMVKHYVFNGTTLRERQQAGLLPSAVIPLTGDAAAELLSLPNGQALL